MDIIEGIKHIIDGNAVIIMGAGASYGAQNAFGNMPLSTSLAKYLYDECDISPDDPFDLQDAAQTYEEQFGATRLITEIRQLLTCAKFTSSHAEIYALPWMRYYTTNYDDVALLAASSKGKKLNPVTITTDFGTMREKENLCIHINGHIGNLNPATLHQEFKLTANSYQSQIGILNSQWGSLLANDLETAKCVVIIGLSLKYDLDLSRIIFKSALSEKTIIIDSPTLTPNGEKRLARYGTVFTIGVDGFADKIVEVKQEYSARQKKPQDRLYTAFSYDYHRLYDLQLPTPENIFRLFINGQYSDALFYKTDGKYSGYVFRKDFDEVRQAVMEGKRFVFVHADMGNGKTACVNELLFRMAREDFHIFVLTNADSSKLGEEIAAICSLAKENRVLVIVEDYINYMDVLCRFSLVSEGNEQYLLTARSALNYNKMPTVLADFSVEENQSIVFDINYLDRVELEHCITIFDHYGLFGKKAGMSQKEKLTYLSARDGGARKFQSIMLDIIQSDVIKSKIQEIIGIISNDSRIYHEAVILILLIKVMNLRLSTMDIERISEINISTDALFRSNSTINELLSINNKGDIIIKSPITARYILQKTTKPEEIFKVLLKLVRYAERYDRTEKFSNILTSVISYSHIRSFLKGFENQEQFMIEYYDQLGQLDYYRNNNFFWLQYAISCIETKKFDRAQRYLDSAYGLIPDGFVPFQINNQQARLYLEKLDSGMSTNPREDLIEAHRLLMIPIVSIKDNEFNVVRLFGYYCRKKVSAIMSKVLDKEMRGKMYSDAYNRTTKFMKKHPEYSNDLNDLMNRLMRACII